MTKTQVRILELATQLAGSDDPHEILRLAALLSFELKKLVQTNTK